MDLSPTLVISERKISSSNGRSSRISLGNMVFTNHISQVSYRFLTAENLRLVLSRGSFLLWWRGGLVPEKAKIYIFII